MRAQLAVGPTSTSIPSYHILSSKLCSQPIRIIGAPCGPEERHAITIGQPASLDIGHNGAPPGPTHPPTPPAGLRTFAGCPVQIVQRDPDSGKRRTTASHRTEAARVRPFRRARCERRRCTMTCEMSSQKDTGRSPGGWGPPDPAPTHQTHEGQLPCNDHRRRCEKARPSYHPEAKLFKEKIFERTAVGT